MSRTNVLMGVLAGVAAGAVLGILFAPDKGSETRKKISRKTANAIEDMEDKYDDLVSDVSDKIEAIKSEAKELYQKGKRSIA